MLSLYGRLEAQDRHCLFFMVATNADAKGNYALRHTCTLTLICGYELLYISLDSVGFFRRVFTLGSFPDKDFIESRKNFTSAAMDRFARD